MAEYKLTNKAVEDLTRIWEYTIDKWSEKQADRYYDTLLENCQEIADNPNVGKNYEGIKNELFGFKVNRHIIFYRKSTDKPIEITRILHERMDLKKQDKRIKTGFSRVGGPTASTTGQASHIYPPK